MAGRTGDSIVQKIFQPYVQKTVIPFCGALYCLRRVQLISPGPFLFMEFCVKYRGGITEYTVGTFTMETMAEKLAFETRRGGCDGCTAV